jgi:hypothetical protein
MTKVNAHVVCVDKKKKFSSATLPSDALQRLETAFGAGSWWRDRWTAKAFREAARDVLREHGGLVLIGPSVKFEVPPPFSEMFEPIEISTGLGDDRERLTILSGEKPTQQERLGRVGRWIALSFISSLPLLMVLAYVLGLPARAITIILLAFTGTGLIVWLAVTLGRYGDRCFLVPGGVAMIRRPVRRGRPPRVTVLSRADSCMVFRYVNQGKVVVLKMELWTHAGRTVSRAVSEREAMSVLATWQGEMTPPEDDKLMELVSW